MSHSYENLPASRFLELEHALFDLDVLSNQLTAAANALPLDLINLQRLASSAVTFAYNLQSEINDAIESLSESGLIRMVVDEDGKLGYEINFKD